jgi:hypothetical protein
MMTSANALNGNQKTEIDTVLLAFRWETVLVADHEWMYEELGPFLQECAGTAFGGSASTAWARAAVLQGADRLPSNSRVNPFVKAHASPCDVMGEASSEVNK